MDTQSAEGTSAAITLVTPPEWQERSAAYFEPILDELTRLHGSKPNCQRLTIEQAAESVPPKDVCIVLAGSADAPAALYQLIDTLWTSSTPTILLFDEITNHERRIAGHGALAYTKDESPLVLASTILALRDRQRVVEALKDELRTARRFQGGLQGEMNKLHEELQLASIVQREFLPAQLPETPGFDLQIAFRPAGYVSGDIYDITQVDAEHVGIFLADAVGHGVPAALMTMVMSRSLITRKLIKGVAHALAPSEVLSHLNREMIRQHREVPRFATAVYALLNTTTGVMRIAGAGHPPSLILDATGTTPVETDGGLLGVFPDDSYDETEITLKPGQLLALYTDGLETAFPDRDADSYSRRVPNKRYLAVLQDLAAKTGVHNADSTDAAHSFGSLLDDQLGSLHPLDDATAIFIRRTAKQLSAPPGSPTSLAA